MERSVEKFEKVTSAQVSKIGLVNQHLLEHVRSEVRGADLLWTEAYREYQSGGWQTVSLYNASARAEDVIIRDCSAVPTELLADMPYLRTMIEELGLEIMWARLARQSANSFLFEHVDYTELKDVKRHRVHIPIFTNSSCQFLFGGKSVHLSSEFMWRLAPIHPHGSCNLFGPERIHLIVDCYEDEALRAMMVAESSIDDVVLDLPVLTREEANSQFEQAWSLFRLGFPEAAERSLLRLFFEWRMEPGAGYEMVARLYDMVGNDETARYWRKKSTIMMGQHN